jgi:hypothetical protein
MVLTQAEMAVQLVSPLKVNVGTAQPGNSKPALATAQQLLSSTVAPVVAAVPPQQGHAQAAAAEAVAARCGLQPAL